LPEAVKLLFKLLRSDWEDSNFHASVVDGGKYDCDRVVFKFQRDTLDSESALNNYMNVMSNTNKILHRGRMKRDGNRWGVVDWEEDGTGENIDGVEWVYFSFVVGQD